MQQEIRFASFNVLNLAQPAVKFYDETPPYTDEEYENKIIWLANQLDKMNADVIGIQEVFSPDALKEVLAKTQHYQNAYHAVADVDPSRTNLTPSVALISRFPFVDAPQSVLAFPNKLSQMLEKEHSPISLFTRPILHAHIRLPNAQTINVFVLHLKSKRPDFISNEHESNPHHLGLANLRSLVRRGIESLGVRFLMMNALSENRYPTVVMGDFNDISAASTSQLVMGERPYIIDGKETRLFDALTLQSQEHADISQHYTNIYEGRRETIDHILFSDEFTLNANPSLGYVKSVHYFNEHLTQDDPHASDHGQVMAKVLLQTTP